MRTLSRDPFARSSLVKRTAAYALHGAECRWCGASPRPKGEQAKCRTLYEYGTDSDGGSHTVWHNGAFCSKSCHDSYHGSNPATR